MEIARLDLESIFSFLCFSHHGQFHIIRIFYRIEQRPLSMLTDRVLTEIIATTKSMILWCGTGRSNCRIHRGVPSVPVKGKYRAVRQAFIRYRAGL